MARVASAPPADSAGETLVVEAALVRAVAAYTRALRLSCRAVREPRKATLANDAVAAHVSARAWAEEAVRLAGGAS